MPEPSGELWGTFGALALVVVLVTGVAVVALVLTVVKKHRQVHQPGMPTSARVAYYGSLVYTIFPLDLLPDPVLLDDIAVLVAALLHVSHTARKIATRPLTRRSATGRRARRWSG